MTTENLREMTTLKPGDLVRMVDNHGTVHRSPHGQGHCVLTKDDVVMVVAAYPYKTESVGNIIPLVYVLCETGLYCRTATSFELV